MTRALRTRLFAVAPVALVVLSACGDERHSRSSRAGEATQCEAASVGADALAKGATLCDSQHLVATLAPGRVDAKAGLGALEVPFRVTAAVERDYCFSDDNSEAHSIVVRGADGRAVLELVAGGRCVPATLAAGLYTLRIEHATPGAEDATPDVIHSKLETGDVRSKLAFQSNSCRDCTIDTPWPCASVGTSPKTSYYCGFVGDYRGARFRGRCNADPGTDCVLAGAFDGAKVALGGADELAVTAGRFPGRQLVLGTPEGMTQVPSSFDKVVFDWGGPAPDTVVLRDTTTLKAVFHPFFRNVVNESPSVLVDYFTARDITTAATYRGPPVRVDLASGDFSNTTLDFTRWTFFPPLVDGARSFAGLKFAGATLKGLRSIREGAELVTMRNMSFAGAKLVDCDFDVDSLEGTTFAGATLTNVRLGGHARPVVATGVSFVDATLDGVVVGSPAAAGAPQVFDASGLDASGATVRKLSVTNTKLDSSVWDRATIAPASATEFSFVAQDASLDGARFSRLHAFERVVWQRCSLGAGATPGSRPFSLSLLDSDTLRSWNLEGSTVLADEVAPTTFEGCSFAGATLSGTLTAHAFRGCSFRAARLTSGTSLARSTFQGCDFTEADVSSDMTAVVASTTSFSRASFGGAATMAGAVFTEGAFDGARFCDGASAAGARFERLSLRGVVMPTERESYQESPTELPCVGTIPSEQRRVLGTATAYFCPDGLAGPCVGATDAATDARWAPVRGQSRPVCCTPKPNDPVCTRHTKNAPCASPCDCSSLTCTAGKCT